MKIEVRRMKQTDSLKKVGKLIYESDEYIYPDLFGENRKKALEVIESLLMNPDSIFHWKNYFVAIHAGKIIGILALHKKKVKWNSDVIKDTFHDLGMELTRDFDLVCHAFDDAYNCKQSDNMKIRSVSVKRKCQGKHVASQMFMEIIKRYPDKTIELSVQASNRAAIKLYKKFDFVENGNGRLGYGGRVERKILCQDMIRKKKTV